MVAMISGGLGMVEVVSMLMLLAKGRGKANGEEMGRMARPWEAKVIHIPHPFHPLSNSHLHKEKGRRARAICVERVAT